MIKQIPIGPKDGYIRSVIHVSDIHIRNGNKHQNRFDEYHGVFANLFDKLKIRNNEQSVCVITGDIFHNKSKIESSGIMLFNEFLSKLSKMIPVYIIQGNHDYRQDEPNEPDMLTAFLEKNTMENVFYMNKTGLYQFDDVVFGVVAIDDVLIKGDTSGHIEDLPTFPNWFPSDKVIKIALFHGTICNCTLQNFTNSTTGYPLEWFKDYDYGMFGDIHLQQIHQSTKYKLTWGYSGSLLQQNYGETINNHGFIEWNIRDKTQRFYEIDNAFVLMYISKINHEWIVTNIAPRQPLTTYLQDHKNCNRKIQIKLINHYNNEDIKWLKSVIDEYPNCICRLHFDMRSKNIDIHGEESVWDEQMVHYNTEDYVIQFINEKKYTILEENKEEWINCIKFPENLCIYMDVKKIPDGIKKKIQDKNDYIMKLINSGEDITWDSECNKKNVLTLDRIEWQWLLCYGGNNTFDFGKVSNECVLINGKNGVGKSSFYEIVYLSIFGTSIPSRTNSSRSSDIICVNKPENEIAKTVLYFKLNEDDYKLQRCFKYQIDKTKLQKVNIKLTRYNKTTCSYDQYKSGSAVDIWIRKEIGQPESFLLSSMVSQNTDEDFFVKKPSEQFEILDHAMNMNKINNIINLYKHINLGYISIIESIDSVYSDYINRNGLSSDKLMEELQELEHQFSKYNDEYMILESCKEDINRKLIHDSNKYVFDHLSDMELCEKIEALKNRHDYDKSFNIISEYEKYEKEYHEYKDNIKELQETYNSVFGVYLNQDELSPENNGEVLLLDKVTISMSSFDKMIQIEHDISNAFGRMINSSEILEIKDNIKKYIGSISKKLGSLLENKEVLKKNIDRIICSKPEANKYTEKMHKHKTTTYQALVEKINNSYSSVREFEEIVKCIDVDSTYNLMSSEDFSILEQEIHSAPAVYKLKKNAFEEAQITCNDQKENIEKELDILLHEERVLGKKKETLERKYQKNHDKWIASYNEMTECTKPINETDKKIYVSQIKKHDANRDVFDDTLKTYEKIQKQIHEYVGIQTQTKEAYMKLSELQERVDLLSKCEYNDECWACAKNPCKLEKDMLLSSINILKKTIYENEEQLSSFDMNLEFLKQQERTFEIWLDEYNQIETKYANMKRCVEEFDKTKRIVNLHSRHNKTKLSVKEELDRIDHASKDIEIKINEKREELNELNNQHRVLLQKDSYEIWQKKIAKYEKEFRERRLRRDNKFELELYQQLEIFRVEEEEWSTDMGLLMKNKKWCDDLKILQDDLNNVNDEINETNIDMKNKEKELFENDKWVELINEYEKAYEAYKKYKQEVDIYCKNNIRCFVKKTHILKQKIELCRMHNCYTNRTHKKEYEATKRKITTVKTTLEELKILIDRKKIEKNKQCEIESIINDYGNFLKLLTKKRDIIDTIKMSLHEYRWWIYDTKMLKVLLKETNNVITMMTGHHDVKLDGTISKSMKHVFTFDWRLNCNGNIICIEKSSGFQRFVIGLGMRIALSRIGATHIKCSQLFIDEGFNSCDNVHLKKVSQFLENVINIYKGVILVSHLEDIRDSVSRVIEIEQKRNGKNKISQIIF